MTQFIVTTKPSSDSGGGKNFKKGWARRWRLFGMYFYISNIRLKKRPLRDIKYDGFLKDILTKNKMKLYERQGHRCPHCQTELPYEQMELHHILPIARYPELTASIRNGILLCHRCHKEIHCNPYLNIRIMEAKAEELGIDLKERYNN